MDFDNLTSAVLGPIFEKYGFHVERHHENYTRFKSSTVSITVCHDKRDWSNSLYIGDEFSCPIDEEVISTIFNAYYKIDQVSIEAFISTLGLFFENEGTTLLKGDRVTINAIEAYTVKKSESYTSELKNRRIFDAADKAWQDHRFGDFIEYISELKEYELSPSYRKKYEIAKSKHLTQS
jgi:hypothetical protein